MAKKSTKTTKSKASRTNKNTGKTAQVSRGIHPAYGIIFTLAIALFVAITFSVVAYNQLRSLDTPFAADKLEVFDHLADSYIREMEYTANDKPTIKQMTGYGVSDEDGVFYITFDFYPYDVVDNNRVVDGDVRHGIMYFWKDQDHNTYSHAFSYHDDASYHPEGSYVKVEQ